MAHLMSNGDSAIKVPAGSELEKAIAQAGSVAEIQNLLHQAAVNQRLIEPDPFDTDGKNWFAYKPVETPQPKGLAKSIVIDGVKHIVEGSTEAELTASELTLMRSLFSKPSVTEQPRGTDGKFISNMPTPVEAEERIAQLLEQQDPAATAQAEIVRKALEAQGVSVDDLKSYSESKRNEKYQSSWSDATATFRQNHPEWQGGSANMAIVAQLLAEHNMTDAEDKAAALEAVYNHAVENNLLVENEELAQAKSIAEATDYETLKARVGYRGVDVRGSGFFGGR